MKRIKIKKIDKSIATKKLDPLTKQKILGAMQKLNPNSFRWTNSMFDRSLEECISMGSKITNEIDMLDYLSNIIFKSPSEAIKFLNSINIKLQK